MGRESRTFGSEHFSIMQIISCGSSFFSIDPRTPGTHLTERFAKYYNSDLISLAKPGSSNFAIRLQLETAIKMQPDVILFEFTNAQKTDLVTTALGENTVYKKDNLAHNIRYTNYENIVPSVIDTGKQTIVSDGIKNFIDAECFPENEKLTPNAKRAMQYWFTELYDEQLKYHQDYFICSSVFYELERAKIPYVWTRGDLSMFDWSNYHNQVSDAGNPWNDWTDPGILSVYHTTPEKQAELVTHWIQTYEDSWNIR